MTNGFQHKAQQRVKNSRDELLSDDSATERHLEVVLNAERSVIAAMMLGADAIHVARAIVDPLDFYRMAHQRVFATICALADRAERPDLVTLSHELGRRDELALVGGPAALAMLMEYAVCTANVAIHARIVLEAAQKRRLRRLGLAIQQWGEDPTVSAADMLARGQDGLAGVAARFSEGAARAR